MSSAPSLNCCRQWCDVKQREGPLLFAHAHSETAVFHTSYSRELTKILRKQLHYRRFDEFLSINCLFLKTVQIAYFTIHIIIRTHTNIYLGVSRGRGNIGQETYRKTEFMKGNQRKQLSIFRLSAKLFEISPRSYKERSYIVNSLYKIVLYRTILCVQDIKNE